ncbi:16S rRNA (uracil(1498)-N(3))-methyltransferase [Geobacillus stearothermophilus]|uniref:16S rRNA (uracil(1498)-N(3))-methyltransferase n=1 Tax=Geobacillus stearothermophilus TaxID=1422 RepID=UPI002E1CB461|nr:16S rRNA (uracil(1498)-N(3))-methyltransferase [Geobacillus stearothermophilus]MED4269809.1 16S rRNA (uracil(1498)-N(3))-methyltransferase [Geobacillus stearothermophilus]MED4299961.1 16S rRNA (uracil(1498)-N(3))-methyltransferase [Geobacillus stearothermophilus]
MQRYFVSERERRGEVVTISGADAHHIARVMRMKPGDGIICVFPDGRTAVCSIEQIASEHVRARIVQWKEEGRELPVRIYIAQGLPKGEKWEFVIQKGTELGAAGFLPFFAARSVVKWDMKKAEKKVERWKKIAKEAAEQAERTSLPEVRAPLSLDALLAFGETVDQRLFAYEEEGRGGRHGSLPALLAGLKPGGTMLAVFGPEGGFSPEEAKRLRQGGFLPCSLGPRILRTETAPLYLLAAASYEWELRAPDWEAAQQ